MTKSHDQRYLVTRQYANGSNLNIRTGFQAHYSTSPVKWHDWLFDQIETNPDAAVLEVGCGTGIFWLANRERIPAGWKLTLTDLSHGMIRDAKRSLSFLGKQAQFVVSDVQLMKFETNSYDVVLASDVLHHVPNALRAVLEVERVLKRGGQFYAATPGRNHLVELFELSNGIPQLEGIADWRFDNQTFTIENGQSLLDNVFSRVEFHPYPDGLIIDSAEPVVDYLLSWMPEASENLRLEMGGILRERAITAIEAGGGALRVQTSCGLFICTK